MSKRILVVDDEADTNMVLRVMLEENGFIVDSYENPNLALENFRPHFYDLLILDIKMPGMSGFSFYREIEKWDENEGMLLTAGEMYYGAYSDIFSSLPDNCLIQKPVTNEELLRHIDEVMYGGHKNYY